MTAQEMMMTSEEMDELVSRLGKMLEPKLLHIEALAQEANSLARGTAIQMTIIFDKIGSIEDRMETLEKRMDSLEIAALGRRQ
jgi:Mg2+ and Co2+ transporter CorA